MSGDEGRRQGAAWTEAQKRIKLPTTFTRLRSQKIVKTETSLGKRRVIRFSHMEAEKLTAEALEMGTSECGLLFCAYVEALARVLDTRQVTVGFVASRRIVPETHTLIANLMDYFPITIDIDFTVSRHARWGLISDVMFQICENQMYPVSALTFPPGPGRDSAGDPFQISFNYAERGTINDSSVFDDIEFIETETSVRELALYVVRRDGGELTATARYNSLRVADTDVERLLGNLRANLELPTTVYT
jgi:hypothetical protein